jgi:hypothetical protein
VFSVSYLKVTVSVVPSDRAAQSKGSAWLGASLPEMEREPAPEMSCLFEMYIMDKEQKEVCVS